METRRDGDLRMFRCWRKKTCFFGGFYKKMGQSNINVEISLTYAKHRVSEGLLPLPQNSAARAFYFFKKYVMLKV